MENMKCVDRSQTVYNVYLFRVVGLYKNERTFLLVKLPHFHTFCGIHFGQARLKT